MRDEQIGINSSDIIYNQMSIEELKTSLGHVLTRLRVLEENERARAREEHERDMID